MELPSNVPKKKETASPLRIIFQKRTVLEPGGQGDEK